MVGMYHEAWFIPPFEWCAPSNSLDFPRWTSPDVMGDVMNMDTTIAPRRSLLIFDPRSITL